MESKLTITLVLYKKLRMADFYKSLFSALAQVGGSFRVQVYLDEVESPVNYPDVTMIRLPREVCGRPAKVREYIVRHVETDYLAFWDSDDIYSVDRVYKQMKQMKEEDSDLCYSDFALFDDERIHSKSFFGIIGLFERKIDLFMENYIGFGTIMAKTAFLKGLIPFPDIDLLDWWIGIQGKLKNVAISCHPEILGYYRVYDFSRSILYENITIDDFAREKENKIKLYSLFEGCGENFKNLKNYYSDLNVQTMYPALKRSFLNSEYKNIWGGLLRYE